MEVLFLIRIITPWTELYISNIYNMCVFMCIYMHIYLHIYADNSHEIMYRCRCKIYEKKNPGYIYIYDLCSLRQSFIYAFT